MRKNDKDFVEGYYDGLGIRLGVTEQLSIGQDLLSLKKTRSIDKKRT